MFITVSNDIDDHIETAATLKFGKRVAKIVLAETKSDEKINGLRRLETQLQNIDREIEPIKRELQQ